jgi:PhoD-like phosphatase
VPADLIGPVVGHTDHASTRVWICSDFDPEDLALRIGGRFFGFAPTDPTEGLGTALATATGLQADREYRYAVLWRSVIVGRGSVRTMPPLGSFADMPFLVASCSSPDDIGLWGMCGETLDRLKPRFLLLIGDQVYQEVWGRERSGEIRTRTERLDALVETYRKSWTRTEVAKVLANVPTYMMWDDHEIRDGWGSWASDSPTLAAQHPRGAARIYAPVNSYFEDALHVTWHFQLSHNPTTIEQGVGNEAWHMSTPQPNKRDAFPFAFEAGRLAVISVDSRGARDVFRESSPVLGDEQWQVVERYVRQLPAQIDALIVITPTPIVAMAPDGLVQDLLGDRNEDEGFFERGDADATFELQEQGGGPDLWKQTPEVPLTSLLSPGSTRGVAALGRYLGLQEDNIDDARDQWTNVRSLPECERLIRLVLEARTVNRLPSAPRGVVFLGGDLHIGARYDVTVDDVVIPTLISSGIAVKVDDFAPIGIYIDDDFDVASGIHAKLLEYRPDYNFGYGHVVFGAGSPQVNLAVCGEGVSASLKFGLR